MESGIQTWTRQATRRFTKDKYRNNDLLAGTVDRLSDETDEPKVRVPVHVGEKSAE
jgi:hypothetical protein